MVELINIALICSADLLYCDELMKLTQRAIFLFWLPLFSSWLMMTVEGPITSAVISRMPDAITMLAAFGVVMSLSVFIESPIINLLATSTALVKDQASYRLGQKFTLALIVFLTLVTAAVGFSSTVFDLVIGQILGVPKDIMVWVRPGMRIMLLFSAAIGWRRFQQGVLINLDMGKRIAQGTAVRLVIMIVILLGLAYGTDLPGIHVAATGIIVGILAESAFITFHTRRGVTQLPAEKEGEPLTLKQLFWFHLPLAGTSILVLIVQPIVAASLARMANPTQSLAAWPIIFQMLLVLRAPALSLPEVVISKTDGAETWLPIRTFSLSMTIVMLVFTGLFIFTPMSTFYFARLQGLDDNLVQMIKQAIPWLLLFPALWVINSWLRGLLIRFGETGAVNASMATNLIITLIVLFVGVSTGAPGLVIASMAMVLAAAGETAYQAWRLTQIIDGGYQLLTGRN